MAEVGGRRLGVGGLSGGVVVADVFAGETFEDEDHDVAPAGKEGDGVGVGGDVDGGVDGGELLLGQVVGVLEGTLADGADEGEGGVEDDGGLLGGVDVLVGVGDGDGACVACEASTHGEDGEGDGHEEGQGVDEVVVAKVEG